MAKLILFNKPFQVLTQFRAKDEKRTLADYISIPQIYPAGRLDYDSEGLLLLTDSGQLQHKISHPNHKQWKYACKISRMMQSSFANLYRHAQGAKTKMSAEEHQNPGKKILLFFVQSYL